MTRAERLARIVEKLRIEGSVSVKNLSKEMNVSEPTIRRDLAEIAENLELPVIRVHGGLILDVQKGGIEPLFEAKLSLMKEQKQRIAQKALEFVEDGDSIILDSGTTALFLAKLLYKKKGLKVITVDIKVAHELSLSQDIDVYIVAGQIRNGFYTIGSALAEASLRQFYADKAFLTADAIDPQLGVMNSSMFEVGVKRTITECAKMVILIADHSKIGKRGLVKVCDLSDVDVFITSKGADPQMIETMSRSVSNLIEV